MSKQEYKLVVLKLVKFLIIFLIVDFTLGSAFKQIFCNQKSGKYARMTYAIEEVSSEILIFGSSHANRHYVPDVFEKELGQTTYNCGVLGQELIFQTALQQIILNRTKPKLIILNIDKNWLFKAQDAYDGLSDFYPYYWDHREILKPILKLESSLIDFKLLFKSYQTNSTIIHAVKYYFSPQVAIKGYVPSYQKMEKPDNFDSNELNVQKIKEEEFDENFIWAYKTFINTAKKENIELVFAISPNVYKIDYSNNKSLEKMKAIAEEENIPIFDFSNDKRFLYAFDLFRDRSHLNDVGAHLFSESLAELIKKKKTFIKKPQDISKTIGINPVQPTIYPDKNFTLNSFLPID